MTQVTHHQQHQLASLNDPAIEMDFSSTFTVHSDQSQDSGIEIESPPPSQYTQRSISASDSSPCSSSSPTSTTTDTEDKLTIEARRQASRLGARRRRGSESRLFQELANTLVPDTPLDKLTTLRLAVSHLTLRRILQALGAPPSSTSASTSSNHVTRIEDALGGGFLLILSSRGDIIYISNSVSHSLGYSSLDLIGRNVFDMCNPGDRAELLGILSSSSSGGGFSRGRRLSALIRLKCSTRKAREPSHMRTDSYNVFHVSGRLLVDPTFGGAGEFFVGTADPLPHPADNRFPLWPFMSRQMFTTVHSVDMKFVSADASFSKFLGYERAEFVGLSCYEFMHPDDMQEDAMHIKSLYEKGQVQTDKFRILKKGGGHAWVYSQKTSLNSNAVISSRNRTIIVCRSFVVGVEESDEIISYVQVSSQSAPARPIMSKEPPRFLTPPPSCPTIEVIEAAAPASTSSLPNYGTSGDSLSPMSYTNSHESSLPSSSPQMYNYSPVSMDESSYEETSNPIPASAVNSEALTSDLQSLVGEIDFGALPEFTNALEGFFTSQEDCKPSNACSASYEDAMWSSWPHSTPNSFSPPTAPPPKILGKRTQSYVSNDNGSFFQFDTAGRTNTTYYKSQPISVPVVPVPGTPAPVSQYPTLVHLLRTDGMGGCGGVSVGGGVTVKKPKSYQF